LYNIGVNERGLLRIGELSRRSGVSPELLRAWERRYDLLRPTRSPGGLRLYSHDDLARVEAMRRHLGEGLAAAEAAVLAARPEAAVEGLPAAPAEARLELAAALSSLDEQQAHEILDRLLAAATLDTTLSQVVLPYLHDLGDRWGRGDASIAEEHFASSFLRGRLLGLARGWGRGLGEPVLLACAPGERHDLGLIAFGLALRARGWRIVFLGADTPVTSVAEAARFSNPRFVVLSSVNADRFNADELRPLAVAHALCLGGAGAAEGGEGIDALRLSGDPAEEADRLTGLAQGDAA
jgi:MerR family transcriptional regulator, light-induced transcriptional regulator